MEKLLHFTKNDSFRVVCSEAAVREFSVKLYRYYIAEKCRLQDAGLTLIIGRRVAESYKRSHYHTFHLPSDLLS